MKNRIIPAALLVAVFVVGSSFAQDWYQERERVFAGNNWRPQLFSQVRATWTISIAPNLPVVTKTTESSKPKTGFPSSRTTWTTAGMTTTC